MAGGRKGGEEAGKRKKEREGRREREKKKGEMLARRSFQESAPMTSTHLQLDYCNYLLTGQLPARFSESALTHRTDFCDSMAISRTYSAHRFLLRWFFSFQLFITTSRVRLLD